MRAYYFSESNKKLRYGDDRQIRKGRTHKVKGEPVMCEHGLHASKRALDALGYAPGSYLWVVEMAGKIVEGDDKIVATERAYIDGFEASDLLREFARKQALINIEKIYKYCSKKDYDLIVKYLETGDPNIQDAAESAARSAAWSAAESAARSAAWSAARSAARSAAWSAAESDANTMLEKMINERLK